MFDADIAYHARQRPRAPALITPGRRASYAELDADVNRFAGGLLGLGVTPERGVTAVESRSAYHRHVLLAALARLGVATTSPDDPDADLRLSDGPGEPDEDVLRLSDAWIEAVEASPPPAPRAPRRGPEGLARVLLSRGAAGEARRVPVTWAGLAAEGRCGVVAYAAGRLGAWVVPAGAEPGRAYLLAALAWSLGAAVAADVPLAETAVLLERETPGLLVVTPHQLRTFLALLPPAFRPIPDLRILVTDPGLPPAVTQEARLRLTPDVQMIYDTPETGLAACGPASRLENTPGLAGWPVPGVELEVVDADGAPVRDGVVGEIRIRSDRICAGYLGVGAGLGDDAFPTGDLGRRLSDGSLIVAGRLEERMTIGGVVVMPQLLENAALSHPDVRDAAAFAVPDATGQMQCWMAIAAAEGLSRESLLAHLARSPQLLPEVRFAWTDAVPRDGAGRIEREPLRAQVIAALSQPAGA